jgi:hypothetical protein
MMSAPNSSTVQDPITTRLALKPGVEARSSATGFVDGAWWPGSRDLADEIPALLAALPKALGRVERVSYNLATWGATVRILHIDGAAVHLAGYRAQNADTVDVLGRDHRVTLLVVPPEATEDAARAALATASAPGNTDSPADLLATSGARPGVPVAAA